MNILKPKLIVTGSPSTTHFWAIPNAMGKSNSSEVGKESFVQLQIWVLPIPRSGEQEGGSEMIDSSA